MSNYQSAEECYLNFGASLDVGAWRLVLANQEIAGMAWTASATGTAAAVPIHPASATHGTRKLVYEHADGPWKVR